MRNLLQYLVTVWRYVLKKVLLLSIETDESKRWYYLSAHWLHGDVLLSNITCFDFCWFTAVMHAATIVLTNCFKMRNFFQKKLPKLIWEQAASSPLVADPFIATVHNRSTVFPMWRQRARPSNTRFSGSTYSPFQTASRSVRPFLHSQSHFLFVCYIAPPYSNFCFPLVWGGFASQQTTPAYCRSILYRPAALPDRTPTVSKHWR